MIDDGATVAVDDEHRGLVELRSGRTLRDKVLECDDRHRAMPAYRERNVAICLVLNAADERDGRVDDSSHQGIRLRGLEAHERAAVRDGGEAHASALAHEALLGEDGVQWLVSGVDHGVVVAHLAWNYPLGNAGLKIAPSVVSGCACVIKPSSQTPLATLYLGEICERIGFPAGVINIISGPSSEVAKTLNESKIPRMIALIGSSETGLQIMRESATSIKKYAFECGGNAPVIVMDDVNIQETAAAIVAKKVGFAGQTCVNYNRIYIHRSIYENMIKAIATELDRVILGKGRDPGYVMGPVINMEARDRMLSLIKDAIRHGAKLVKGGEVPEAFRAGSYITPALLRDVTDDMRVSTEEIFGPIIPVQPFDDLDEALQKANNTIYGLSAYFYGHRAPEIAKAFEALEAGEIFINNSPGTEQTPHAGVKQSGVGVDKSPWSLEEFYDYKYMGLKP